LKLKCTEEEKKGGFMIGDLLYRKNQEEMLRLEKLLNTVKNKEKALKEKKNLNFFDEIYLLRLWKDAIDILTRQQEVNNDSIVILERQTRRLNGILK